MSSPEETGPEATTPDESPPADEGRSFGIDDFRGEPTRDLAAWRWLWEEDLSVPIESHRPGLVGKLIVRVKGWFRPVVKAPVADLWDRQRAFNIILLDEMRQGFAELSHDLANVRDDLLRDIRQIRGDLLRDVRNNHRRITHLEGFKREGFDDVMRHSDALYAVVDQKLDRYRQQSRELWSRLGGLLARLEGEPAAAARQPVSAALARGWVDQDYLALEDRFRGTREDILERVAAYLPHLRAAAGDTREVIDLGCGRGETLTALASSGIRARGIDASEEMVRQCGEQGHTAQQGDLFDFLEGCDEASLGGIVSLHVIEHLPAESVDRLVRLAWRALLPGGVLILETPNPLSLVVAARNFWIDPTHLRPIHPATLTLAFELAGFDPVERIDLRPFTADDLLPEIDLNDVAEGSKELAHEVNVLRDRLNDLLYGAQDYALVGTRPKG